MSNRAQKADALIKKEKDRFLEENRKLVQAEMITLNRDDPDPELEK
jgi:hypothetical protein